MLQENSQPDFVKIFSGSKYIATLITALLLALISLALEDTSRDEADTPVMIRLSNIEHREDNRDCNNSGLV